MVNLGFPGVSVVNNLPAMQELQVQSLGWEHPVDKELPTHSDILSRIIPWTETGRLQSTGSQRVGHYRSNFARTMIFVAFSVKNEKVKAKQIQLVTTLSILASSISKMNVMSRNITFIETIRAKALSRWSKNRQGKTWVLNALSEQLYQF